MTMKKLVAGLLLLGSLFALNGCGGGGGGDGGGGTPGGGQSTVSGTAAVGAPLAGAQVTVKDAQGASRTGTTAADGTYSVDSAGLTPPFFVQVTRPGGDLYSVSADANTSTTINVTPLTDLITRAWYNVQGVSVDTAFGAPAANPAPLPREVEILGTLVQDLVQLWLDDAGVNSAGFNLISTPFNADGTGVDRVLDLATVNPGTGQITLTDGTISQTSTLSAASGGITVSTTTTAPSGTSSSTVSTVVPVQAAQRAALDGITAAMNGFAGVINARGSALQAADLLPSIDASLLHDGFNASGFAADWVDFAGVTVSFELAQVKSLDLTSNVANAIFELAETQEGQTTRTKEEFFFRKVNDAWLLSGNGRIADVAIAAEARTEHTTGGPGINGANLQADLLAPAGTVTAVTVSGGGIWNNTPIPQASTEVGPSGNIDTFFINSGVLSSPVPAGTPFTFRLTTPGGSVTTYTVTSNAFTTERISITGQTGNALADARLGQPLSVSWTLPATFAIKNIELEGLAFTGVSTNPSTLKCSTEAAGLGTTATATQVTIPAVCNGQPVQEVILSLLVEGVNGERDQVFHYFK